MATPDKSRSRFFLIALLVTSLIIVTLDLRGSVPGQTFRGITNTVLAPFQSFFRFFYDPINNFISEASNLGRSADKINELEERNAKLEEELSRFKVATRELEQLKDVLDLAAAGRYKSVPARVIAAGSAAGFSRTIELDVGARDGVATDMTVISGAGLVGRVISASESTSIALLLDDETFKAGIRMEASGILGVISGTGNSQLSLTLFDSSSELNAGDRMVARGSSNSRPFVPGVPVGTITSVDQNSGTLTKTALVKPFVNLNSLEVVAVVTGKVRVNPRDSLLPPAPKPTPTPTVTVYITPTPEPSPTKSKKAN
ncbi:MAG: rod shape-determining protein MreC [Actinobacteria bacterium]|nr:rod shape-determining protein MreC [Actinomycetota bacterium]